MPINQPEEARAAWVSNSNKNKEKGERMRERSYTLLVAVIAALLVVMAFTLPAQGAQEVCPEAGKVESQVDGDIDGLVLDAGTQVCVKGSTTVVYTTADGVATLRQLLGINKNVSHYTVLGQETTTTTVPETTTTTVEGTTTTTAVEETTTTSLGVVGKDVVPPPPRETTTLPTPVTTEQPEAPEELPHTGQTENLALLAIGLLLTGATLVAATRKETYEV